MSQGNLKAIEKVYERWSVGDLHASVDLLDPHVVLVNEPEFEVGEPAYGIEAVLSYTRRMLEAWNQFAIEAEELIVAGDSVVVAVRQHGVGAGSGVATELHYFMVWTFRGNKVVRLESFRDRARALEAAGLSE
jgi:ketosteroid isomerase-like protein